MFEQAAVTRGRTPARESHEWTTDENHNTLCDARTALRFLETNLLTSTEFPLNVIHELNSDAVV